MSGAPMSPAVPDALAANQGGKLTDQQRQQYRGKDRSFRKTELYVAVGAAIIGVLVLTSTGPSPDAAFRPIAAIAAFAVAGALVYRSIVAADSLSRDVAAGVVESLEGAVLREVRQGSGSGVEFFYLSVAGQRFEVSGSVYRAAPEAGYVRVYYLPRSRTVVNLERLPDPPLPAGVASSPAEVAKTALAGVLSHDVNQRAEAMAQLAEVKAELDEGRTTSPEPPSSGSTDPRPLAEAIVGTWRMGPIAVTFAPDGTMSTNLPGGANQAGRWSVDPSGQLHAQVAGRDQVGQAWVAGDTLTIRDGDEGLQLRRA